MLMRWGVALAVLGGTLAGCGSPSLPDPGGCPAFTAFESSVLQERAYQISISRELEAIVQLDAGFRGRWTERRLRELESFRSDFVTYAHLTKCRVEFMLEITVPPLAPAEFVARLRDYGNRMIAAMEEGREAVATRNSSRYRDWVKTVDALAAETGSLLDEALGRST